MKKAKIKSPKLKQKSEKEIEKARVKGLKAEIAEQKEKALKEVKIKTGKYRYFCDSCTGIAFWSDIPNKGTTKICPHCNSEFVTRVENFILD
ncbi:MAG: hypothetical protein H8D23_03940 [Candidatus Brocadiales bacterium]|nr:hypothetical protein [Candidatus Brocadiales bacterium]